MSHQIQSLTIWEVYLHDIAYPKSYLVTIDPNVVQMNFKIFPNHGTSYTRLSVPDFLRIMVLWTELLKPLKKPYKNQKRKYWPIFCLVSATHNQKQLWYILLRVDDETKLQTLAPSLNLNVSTKTKLKKSANPENFNHWIETTLR